MFHSAKAARRSHRLSVVDSQLDKLSTLIPKIEAGEIDDDQCNPYYVIEEVKMMSYLIFDDPNLEPEQVEDHLFNNVAECLFQLVTLTLLSLQSKRSVNLLKIHQAIINDYPVAHLNSKFEFKNTELMYQRLSLMDMLHTLLDPIEVKEGVYQSVVDSIQAYLVS